MPDNAIVPVVMPGETEAVLNVTFSGQNGDLPDCVAFDAPDEQIRFWATEATRMGVPGILADADADFSDFVVDRFRATEEIPYNRIFLRPKTPFGRQMVEDIEDSILVEMRLRNDDGPSITIQELAKRLGINLGA